MSGVYSLVKAAGAVGRKMDTVSNNLANVNTTGFKEDQPSFREVLSKAQQVRRNPKKSDSCPMNTWISMWAWRNLP